MSQATGNGKLIESLVADREVVALAFRQKLEPIEGPDVPIFPPTYPANKDTKKHLHDTPYTVNKTKDDVWVCDLDSVQSQANRMEAAFTGELAGDVPQHAVQAGKAGNHRRVALTDLGHRAADASIRATDLAGDIREWMLAFHSGDPAPLARFAPTTLVYGGWDSRETQVKIPRVVRSQIRAHDVSVFTGSAQYSGAFKQEELDLTDAEWKAGAEVGFAPTPSVDAHGGILVRGEIVHSASITLNGIRKHRIRKHRTDDGSDVLPNYLLGLALGGLLVGSRDYELRSGCFLVPAAPAEWRAVTRSGERRSIEVDESAVLEELRETAKKWSETAGVTLDVEPEIHEYDSKIAKAMIAKSKKKGQGDAGA